MTQDEIDIMWQKAMQESIKDGEMFTRYHFAKLVAEAEREACAKVCEKQIKIFLSPQYKTGQPLSSFGERTAIASCIEAIKARGQA
jgi:hypothetical protein